MVNKFTLQCYYASNYCVINGRAKDFDHRCIYQRQNMAKLPNQTVDLVFF